MTMETQTSVDSTQAWLNRLDLAVLRMMFDQLDGDPFGLVFTKQVTLAMRPGLDDQRLSYAESLQWLREGPYEVE